MWGEQNCRSDGISLRTIHPLMTSTSVPSTHLPEEVVQHLLVPAYMSLSVDGEQPPPQFDAGGRRRAVALDVDVVRKLIRLQLPLWSENIHRGHD